MQSTRGPWPIVLLALSVVAVSLPAADTLRIATYNLENYLETPVGTRPASAESSRASALSAVTGANDSRLRPGS